MSYTPGLWLEPQLATDEQNRWIDRNAGRDGQYICRSLNNSCAQKSLDYPSLQSHLHEASTLWQQLAAHLATAARTGVHVGELVAQAWLPARSPAQTCHSALTEAIAARHRAGGGPPRSPRRRLCHAQRGPRPRPKPEAPNMFWPSWKRCAPNCTCCRSPAVSILPAKSPSLPSSSLRCRSRWPKRWPGWRRCRSRSSRWVPQRGAKSGWRCVPWRK